MKEIGAVALAMLTVLTLGSLAALAGEAEQKAAPARKVVEVRIEDLTKPPAPAAAPAAAPLAEAAPVPAAEAAQTAQAAEPLTADQIAERLVGALKARIVKAGLTSIAVAPIAASREGWMADALAQSVEASLLAAGCRVISHNQFAPLLTDRQLGAESLKDPDVLLGLTRILGADAALSGRIWLAGNTASVLVSIVRADGVFVGMAEVVDVTIVFAPPAAAQAEAAPVVEIRVNGNAPPPGPDAVLLKNGTRYDGVIIANNDDMVLIETAAGIVRADKADVMGIVQTSRPKH